MQVYGTNYVHGPQSVSAPHAGRVGAQALQRPASTGPTDEVQFSTAAQLLDSVRELPDIRADRVAELRAAIASGQYETPERIEGALARLLDEIG